MIRQFIYKQVSRFVFPNKGITHIKRSPRIIVSLTSYPGRIKVVPETIDSLLRQNLKPDAVVLWLGIEKFPNRDKDLPDKLLRYKKHGLEIRWCNDVRSYTKLVPALQTFPDDIIVTVDDDVIYQEDWLEKLYAAHIQYPEEILCHHAFSPQFDKNNEIVKLNIRKSPAILAPCEHAAGIGGVLYPPHSLHSDTTNKELFMKLAPHNDDMWFWAMAHLQNTPIRLIDGHCENIICIPETQEAGLWQTTNSKGEGSKQFHNIINHYPQIKDLISAVKDTHI